MDINYTISKAQKDDVSTVGAIYEKIHVQEALGKMHTGWLKGIYPTMKTAFEAYERNDLFVCRREEIVVACAIINKVQVDVYSKCEWQYKADDDKIMVLHTLVVDPDFSGHGAGRAFVAFYEKYAAENGCTVLRMDTNEKNSAARSLYNKLGYREAGIFPCVFNGMPDINLVLLEKKI